MSRAFQRSACTAGNNETLWRIAQCNPSMRCCKIARILQVRFRKSPTAPVRVPRYAQPLITLHQRRAMICLH
jgi:hypothetical protein